MHAHILYSHSEMSPPHLPFDPVNGLLRREGRCQPLPHPLHGHEGGEEPQHHVSVARRSGAANIRVNVGARAGDRRVADAAKTGQKF